ncbi:MAG: sulfatase-like hydrolase/transferase [Anaerolineae bacterium]|nr:sulfatase-like hydrolase/transferase [Anaerolineae bacterium]
MKRPNVLLLYTDQQRWDTIHAGGNPHIKTPNLDRLAQEGALFTRCYCNSPVCMPSRQSMLSGTYPSVNGCTDNGIEFDEDRLTLMDVLSTYGYTTANLGKLHFKNHSDREHRELHPKYGFDHLVLSDEPGCYDDAYIKWVEERAPEWVEKCRIALPPAYDGPQNNAPDRDPVRPYTFEAPENLSHSAFVADETISFIHQQTSGKSWFAIAGFYAPHCPFSTPERFVAMYEQSTMPLPSFDLDGLPHPWDGAHRDVSDEQWQKVKLYYYALITHVDDCVGQILDALEASDQMDETLIIFTSDHGEHLGDHGITSKGPPGLDSCIRVPLLIRYPKKITANQQYDELVESLDITSTIVDYCGIQVPPQFQGRSFRGLIEGKEYHPRTSTYTELKNPFRFSWKAIRTERYKYCVNQDGQELLYDHQIDPYEQKNVVSDPTYAAALLEVRQEMLKRWFTVESQYPRKTAAY